MRFLSRKLVLQTCQRSFSWKWSIVFRAVNGCTIVAKLSILFWKNHWHNTICGKWGHRQQRQSTLPYCLLCFHIVCYASILFAMLPYCSLCFHIVRYTISILDLLCNNFMLRFITKCYTKTLVPITGTKSTDPSLAKYWVTEQNEELHSFLKALKKSSKSEVSHLR